MTLRLIALMTILAFSCSVTGCITVSEEHKGAATGAALGGVTGAIGGAVIAGEGSRTKGALIGGLLGGLVGGVIGNYTVDKKKTATETSSKYGYQPETGTTIRLENTSTTPTSVGPGDKVELKATYAVLAPSETTQVAITETREITLNGEIVGNPEVTANHTPGTYNSTVPLFLHADAAKGTYKVVTTIKSAGSKDSQVTTFVVR